MVEIRIARSSDLAPATTACARRLLDDAFEGDFSDTDWEHALGGRHVLAWEGDAIVGHASLVPRRLLNAGRPLRAGYVEALAVRPDLRRRGHGTSLMRALHGLLRNGGQYDLGALSTAEEATGFYAAMGWTRWSGSTSVITPRGLERTPEDDGSIHVLPLIGSIDLRADLACDWREGDVW